MFDEVQKQDALAKDLLQQIEKDETNIQKYRLFIDTVQGRGLGELEKVKGLAVQLAEVMKASGRSLPAE